MKLSKIMLGVKSCIQLQRHLSRCNHFHLGEEINVYKQRDRFLQQCNKILRKKSCQYIFRESFKRKREKLNNI